jgi:tetratricopeptide (TPR) repeat protein
VISLIFLLALMYRESAAALLPLAAACLWFSSDKPWLHRIRECLPVLFLLLPLALYFILRTNAFEIPADQTAQAIGAMGGDRPPEVPAAGNKVSRDVLDAAGIVLIDPSKMASVVALWFDALRLMVWPQPLLVIRQPPDTSFGLAFAIQAMLFALALLAAVRKQTVFLFGLVFFYLAILPSSRIVSEGSLPPLLMDRMLYLPSIGLVMLLAAALAGLSRRVTPRVSLAAGLLIVALLVPVTWGRNHEWSSDLGLLQADFARNPVDNRLLISLINSHARAGNLSSAIELCESDPGRIDKTFLLHRECANVYMARGMPEQAERLLLEAVEKRPKLSWVHFNLGIVYARTGRRDLAREHFEISLEREPLPFLREMIQATALLELYPGDRYRQKQARAHLERALEIQPRAIQARQLLEQLEGRP